MSLFDHLVDEAANAIDLYLFKYGTAPFGELPRVAAEHYVRLDSISMRARQVGVSFDKVLDRALAIIG